MTKMFKTIYYIYDAYIFRGTMRQMHGEGYSKEHAIGVFAFIQLCNLVTIDNLLRTSFILRLPIWASFSLAMLLYFLNRYLFADKKLKEKPSGLMIAGAIFYAIASVAAVCLSFIPIVASK